jgi:hypothetical protein
MPSTSTITNADRRTWSHRSHRSSPFRTTNGTTTDAGRHPALPGRRLGHRWCPYLAGRPELISTDALPCRGRASWPSVSWGCSSMVDVWAGLVSRAVAQRRLGPTTSASTRCASAFCWSARRSRPWSSWSRARRPGHPSALTPAARGSLSGVLGSVSSQYAEPICAVMGIARWTRLGSGRHRGRRRRSRCPRSRSGCRLRRGRTAGRCRVGRAGCWGLRCRRACRCRCRR